MSNKHGCLWNVNNCWNTNIYSYLVTSAGQSSELYLNVHFDGMMVYEMTVDEMTVD